MRRGALVTHSACPSPQSPAPAPSPGRSCGCFGFYTGLRKPRCCCCSARVAVSTHSTPARPAGTVLTQGWDSGASQATVSSDKGVAEGTAKPCGGPARLSRQDGVRSLKVGCWREWAGSAEDHAVGKTQAPLGARMNGHAERPDTLPPAENLGWRRGAHGSLHSTPCASMIKEM